MYEYLSMKYVSSLFLWNTIGVPACDVSWTIDSGEIDR